MSTPALMTPEEIAELRQKLINDLRARRIYSYTWTADSEPLKPPNLFHEVCCCDDDVALCGADVSGEEFKSWDEAKASGDIVCQLCEDAKACFKCGNVYEPFAGGDDDA